MNKRLTTAMADANRLKRAIRTYQIFQHQENGRRFMQHATYNGQYWVFNTLVQAGLKLFTSFLYYKFVRHVS